MELAQYWWFIPVGFVVGAYGTLIGAGGGFVLMPVLLLLFPGEASSVISAISLAVVFLNALSGSVAYSVQGRIDYRSGLLFSAAALPGAVLGAVSTSIIPRHTFDLVFGFFLAAAAILLLVAPDRAQSNGGPPGRGQMARSITDREGNVSVYSYSPAAGILLSLTVGFVSSVLGIGGGIIHVPVLSVLLSFPVHIATATSHFVLAVTALAGTVTHIVAGDLTHGFVRVALLGSGVVVGAQLGARYSPRIKGKWIIRALAFALLAVSVRILGRTWWS